MELKITELSEGDLIFLDIAKELSNLILQDYKCISVKVNYMPHEVAEPTEEWELPENIYSVRSYLQDKNVEVLFSTCGLHLLGENKKPHVHYHLIVKSLPTGEFMSNNSQSRKRWLAKEGNEDYSFDEVSIRFPKKENPVWQHIAYPYKEGRIIGDAKINKIKKSYQDFLLSYATNLYQVSLGNRARQDAVKERKQVSLNDLFQICQKHRGKFNSLREMVLMLDVEYIPALDLDDLPDPKNYKTNCQKIAVHLRVAKYSDC